MYLLRLYLCHFSAYKDALRQTARGYHSLVVDTLLYTYGEGQGIYRSEAFLLLSLIYSQLDDNEVKASQICRFKKLK